MGPQAIHFAVLFGAASAVLLILIPWAYTRFVAGVALAATLVLHPQGTGAAAYLLIATYCLASGRPEARIAIGLGLILIPMPLLARIPIYYPIVWAVLLAIPILLRRPKLELPHFPTLDGWPERLAFALFAFVVALHWFAVLQPEASPDGLAMHLAIPADIARHHVLTYQPDRFVWAVMPMGGDFLYAIAYQLGGEFASRLLNFALFGLLLALLHRAVRRWAGEAASWLLLALFASTPLTGLVTGDLFIENLLAVMILGALLEIESGRLVNAAILAGAALGTKFGALPFVVLLAIYAAWRRPAKRAAFAALAMLAAMAAPTYGIAWSKTGNPIFPFLNDRFHSPLLPADATIRDNRFREPLTWSTPYDLAVHTSRYYEGQDGGFGFQYILLAPFVLAAAAVVRRREVVAPALIGIAASYLILRSEPNVRYLYPALPLLSIPAAALLRRTMYPLLLVLTAANIWFLPAASYWHQDLYRSTPEPIRIVSQWFDRTHPGAPVLLVHDTAIADLSGPVYQNQWHQYAAMDRIRRAPDYSALRRLLNSWDVRYVITRTGNTARATSPRVLRDLIAGCTVTEFAEGDVRAARLLDECTPPEPSAVTLEPGTFDDFDPGIRYTGDWERGSGFGSALSRTTTYSNQAGAEIAVSFRGREITWTFARAPNRGIAEVTLDGEPQVAADLYSPKPQWQQTLTYRTQVSGTHLLIIRVTGKRRTSATDFFIDADGFTVK